MKVCRKCGTIKPLEDFPPKRNTCKHCQYEYTRQWMIKNKEYRQQYCKQYNSQYYQNNTQHIKTMTKQYASTHKADRNKRSCVRLRTDIQHKLATNLRKRLHDSIRDNLKSGSAVRDLGCTILEFKSYLESQFYHNMTWDNWGNGPGTWQIHHIQPLYKFDLTDREQFLKACRYTNLQPLWHEDHMKPGVH